MKHSATYLEQDGSWTACGPAARKPVNDICAPARSLTEFAHPNSHEII
jgi:hypothetical protein